MAGKVKSIINKDRFLMDISTSDYKHTELKVSFQNSIRESLEYLSELTESNIDIPEITDFTWKTIASYYLATIYAENDNREQTINYLSAVSKEKKPDNGIQIKPLDHKTIDNFSLNLLYTILERDDKGVRVGYFSANLDQEKNKISRSLDILKQYDPVSFAEIECFIDTIYLTGATETSYIRSGCNFYMWGLILLYAEESNSIPYYIEHIVHECAHHALNVLNAHDQLVTNGFEERFDAPLRDDPRPMIGLFHAYFVLFRIFLTLNKLSKCGLNEYQVEINSRKSEVLRKALETGEIIKNNAKFTTLGKELYDSIENKMAEFL
ncbi:hypothetical protein CGT85_03280 [Vibrio cholerae]|nr:hypothetical protein CGT85_03280 [Vibrio cholerae]